MRNPAFNPVRRRFLAASAGALGLAAAPQLVRAQAWPSRPITFIVPWPAGGTSDTTMRVLAQEVAKILGTPVVVENKTGASGMIGTAALLGAKPDGYTVGQIPLSVTRFAQLGILKHDPLKDITFIARANGQTFGIAVLPNAKWKSVAELVADAKARPGKITYATAGIGGQTHVGMEEFAMAAGIALNHIPFKGGAPALQALLGGHVELLADSSSWAPHVEAGKLRLLATWGEQRIARFRDVPTLKEAGYDVVVEAPNGVGAPRGLDPQVHAKLREAFRKAILGEEFRKVCGQIDSVVMYQDADDYRKFVAQSYEHEKKLIKALNLKDKMS